MLKVNLGILGAIFYAELIAQFVTDASHCANGDIKMLAGCPLYSKIKIWKN